MVDFNPNFEMIAKQFVEQYYQLFDQPAQLRRKLQCMYHASAMLIFEDDCRQGPVNIIEKLSTLPFQAIQHIVTKLDSMPTANGGVLIMVSGQLKADEDKPLSYSHVFNLHREAESYTIINEIFRLSLHNIPVSWIFLLCLCLPFSHMEEHDKLWHPHSPASVPKKNKRNCLSEQK